MLVMDQLNEALRLRTSCPAASVALTTVVDDVIFALRKRLAN